MAFTGLFGDGPHVRVLDFFAEHPDFDYNIMDLARHSGVARPTVYKVVEEFTARGVVVQTRRIGNSNFYKLNAANAAVQRMLEMREGIASAEAKAPRKAKLPAGRSAKWSR